MTGLWAQELHILRGQRMAAPALIVVMLLAAVSLWAGMAEVSRQREAIERIQPQQAADVAAVAAWVSKAGDPGEAAYYTFHATWDSPSTLAFAAIGQRDVSPYLLRVRALGLEAQLYEGENYNADLAVAGRFDWAFVVTYLAPLFVILLLHDVRSGEREAGRLMLLTSMARREPALWSRWIVLRLVLLWAALCVPFVVAAALSGTSIAQIGAASGIAFAYLTFWALICLWIDRLRWSSLANAATLAAVWLIATLILPALAHLGINAAIAVPQGVELTLAQRENVNGAWDLPKETTMDAFFRTHPEWATTAPVEGFHYKWYYAFHQVGDESVADQSAAYREGLMAREHWARRIAIVLPAVAVQTTMHRLARTDLEAQLDYLDRVREFHGRLRHFYYPYVFNEQPFREADFAKAPRWSELNALRKLPPQQQAE